MNKVRIVIRTLSLLLAVILIGLIGFRLFHSSSKQGGRAIVSPVDYGSVEPFSLTNQFGQEVTHKSLRGKVWVADFIFTRCMGPCPLITKKMSDLQNEFKNKESLRFISFTVDPDFDTPMILEKYGQTYGADSEKWWFLTGPRHEIVDLIGTSFKLAVGAPSQENGQISILHSLHFVLVDEEGRIAGVFDSTNAESMAQLRSELSRLS